MIIIAEQWRHTPNNWIHTKKLASAIVLRPVEIDLTTKFVTKY